jgi:hypothetical protein
VRWRDIYGWYVETLLGTPDSSVTPSTVYERSPSPSPASFLALVERIDNSTLEKLYRPQSQGVTTTGGVEIKNEDVCKATACPIEILIVRAPC